MKLLISSTSKEGGHSITTKSGISKKNSILPIKSKCYSPRGDQKESRWLWEHKDQLIFLDSASPRLHTSWLLRLKVEMLRLSLTLHRLESGLSLRLWAGTNSRGFTVRLALFGLAESKT
jgi:hypothetical protein